MKFKNYLQSISGVGIYPVITLLIFFLFFTILALWAFRASKEHLTRMNQLPLDGSDINTDFTTTNL